MQKQTSKSLPVFCLLTASMMNSMFSPSSYMNFSLSNPAVLQSVQCEDPFFLHPSCIDSCKGPLRGAGLEVLPYKSSFQNHRPFSLYDCPFEPVLIQKRNERERQRVRCVNQGYAKLRNHLPGQNQDKRLSKVETLRAAIRYIKYLQELVDMEVPNISSLPAGVDVGRNSQDLFSGPEYEGHLLDQHRGSEEVRSAQQDLTGHKRQSK